RGAEAHGFRGAVWTGGRVREVIRVEFGVLYSERQAERLLKEIGWSPQKPLRRARQRDEAKGAAFNEERWPPLKKRGSRRPYGRLCRSVGLLPPANGGADLRPERRDARPLGDADAGSPVGDGGSDAGRKAVSTHPGGCLQRERSGAVPPASLETDRREA